MADSRKETRIVEYQLQGNTIDLEKSLKSAISTLDQLDQKLTNVASTSRVVAGRNTNSFGRASTISAAQTQISKLRGTLSSGNLTAVSPDQLNLLNQLNNELSKASAKLGDFNKASAVTNKTLEKTKTVLRQANNAIRQSGIEVSKATKKWSAFGKVFTWATILRSAANLLIKGYKESIKFVETMNLFNVATKGSTESLYQFAEAMTDAYNTDIGPILNAVAVFRQYANTMGLASEQADILGENLTKLGVDLASLYNTTNDEMFNALKSGLAGLTKPLMRYGISVHKATLEQEALALGIDKSWTQFTEAEKVALRYIAILKQTSAAQGDLARTLESPENQLKIASAQVQIFIRNLGTLVTMVTKFVFPVFNGFMIAVNKFLSVMNKAAGYEIPDYSDNLSENNQVLQDGTEDAEEYEEAISGILAPLDEINQATPKENNAIGEIDPRIAEALKGYDNLMDKITTKTDKLAEIFGRVFNEQLFEGIGKILNVVFTAFGDGLDIVIDLLDTLTPVLDVVLTVLGYILGVVADIIQVAIIPVVTWLEGLTSNIWTLIAAFTALNLVMAAANGNWKSMLAYKAAAWFINTAKAIAITTAKLAANTIKLIANKIATLALAAAIWWENASLVAKIGLLTMGAGLVIVPLVLGATGAFQQKANNVPQMATGGVVKQPTLAMIGEGRYNEAVVPLGNSPQFAAMKEGIAEELIRKIAQTPFIQSGQQSRGNVPVILNVNGRELARAIMPDLGYTQPQTGVKLR